MMPFHVWAPGAARVELVMGARRVPMAPGEGGWHEAAVEAEPGAAYRFSVDGAEPVPDPRSPWQPEGVHGPSRTVDHRTFGWTDGAWTGIPLSSAILYELHVGSFTAEGTFEGAIGRLDHLVELGITAVQLMPVTQFPGDRGWGYDVADLFAPHHAYGGPEGLKRLVDACHRRGLAVVIDVVYNHLGPDGNHLARFGPYFTDRYTTPWGPAVNFDGDGSRGVRDLVVENAVMWLRDYHCDGLRLDAVHAIFDSSAVHIVEEIASRVHELQGHLGRQLWVIAESDLNDPRLVTAPEAGGYGCDAQWSDDFHHALHCLLTGERTGYYADFGSLADLATALRHAYVYDGRPSRHRGREHGRRPLGLSGNRFLAYAQNHDQVGNRPRGERISALTSPARLRIAAALVLTSPFVPLLFQGEEWGASTPFPYFTDHRDPALASAVRKGRAEQFTRSGWRADEVPDPGSVETFQSSRLAWGEVAGEPHAGLIAWHRDLMRLRRRLPELTDGRLEAVRVAFDEPACWLLMGRGRVTVAVNLGPAPVRLSCPAGDLLLASGPGVRLHGGLVELPSDSVGIVGP
ncbi:MAG: malto-oligosyltrehalose trehalohydrolase [Candidatus Dormibacteraceae bacterium]